MIIPNLNSFKKIGYDHKLTMKGANYIKRFE
jgi:hypothetical protein